MLAFDELEYLGGLEGAEKIYNPWNEEIKLYRYKNKILALSEPIEDRRKKSISAQYEEGEYFRAATYSPCDGHYNYSPVDWGQVPDIKGSSQYTYGFPLSDIEEENYSFLYPSYSKALLYTEEKGDYRYDLIAVQISTDKAADPDMMYCSNSYAVVSRVDNGEAVLRIETGYTSMPINGDFSDYSVQVYELKDGIVIYTSDFGINSGYTPFITIDEQDKTHLLYGDYTALSESELNESAQISKPIVRFTAEPETNTLYCGDIAYTFDFTKAEAGLDENGQTIPSFTVWHPSEGISAE